MTTEQVAAADALCARLISVVSGKPHHLGSGNYCEGRIRDGFSTG